MEAAVEAQVYFGLCIQHTLEKEGVRLDKKNRGRGAKRTASYYYNYGPRYTREGGLSFFVSESEKVGLGWVGQRR